MDECFSVARYSWGCFELSEERETVRESGVFERTEFDI